MENQHRHIKGYRDLSPKEVALINEVKAEGARIGRLIERVHESLRAQCREPDADLARANEALRAAALAKTNIQQGFMWLIRSVAQPESFV